MHREPAVIWLLLFGVCYAEQPSESCSAIPTMERMDCYPEAYATEDGCRSRGCCWERPKTPTVSACFFPLDYPAFYIRNVTKTHNGMIFNIQRSANNLHVPSEITNLNVELIYETQTRLRIRFTDPLTARWEPPIDITPPPTNSMPTKVDYRVTTENERFGMKIYGAGDRLLLDSTGLLASCLMAGNQFWQIAFRVNAQRGFGPGERRTEFPLQLHKWERRGLWSRDQPPIDDVNLYGVHNFFMGLAANGTAFGIFLLNSNAQEVVMQPLPALTYRTIGGILDFFIFIGPSPQEVVAQYLELIGRPPVPPYWSLGFHLSRYGYESVADMEATLERNRVSKIPVDTLWADIDFMDAYMDWSLDPENFATFGDFVDKKLHKQLGMKAVIMFDAAICTYSGDDYTVYNDGLRRGIYINDSRTNKPLEGLTWPGKSVYPDYSNIETVEWAFDSAAAFHEQVPFDGLWIDMNEPSNFYDGSTEGCLWNSNLDHPPYLPPVLGGTLYSKTICPSALHAMGRHYDLHNLYGYQHAKATSQVLHRLQPDKRPFILSRSTFAGSGRYTYHWSGDNFATWDDLSASIPEILNFNMFGIPMVGADICGFIGDTTEELCVRWSQLGAFYPFSRNHNSKGATVQDPAIWTEPSITAIRKAITLRYQLLPYLYTLLHRAEKNGITVARPLVFEYPQDLTTHAIDKQFLWGSCLLITPVLQEGARKVYGYLPRGDWISFPETKRFHSNGEWFYFDAPLSQIPLHIKAGCILPMHNSNTALTTDEAAYSGIGLLIVLKSPDDGSQSANDLITAKGEIILDDGISRDQAYVHLEFTVINRHLYIVPSVIREHPNQVLKVKKPFTLKFVHLIGLGKSPKCVEINNERSDFFYDTELRTLEIVGNIQAPFSSTTMITWSF